MIKVGDKVRFLNSEGGGVVSKVLSKDMVEVTDADGFDYPTPVTECVVINEAADNDVFSRLKKQDEAKAKQKRKADDEDDEPAPFLKNDAKVPQKQRFDDVDLPTTGKVQPERPEGNVLNVYMAFVPVDSRQLGSTSFEWYLINDSNYELAYTISTGQIKVERQASGFIQPNTKEFINEFTPDELNAFEHLNVQFIAFKKNKAYVQKPTADVHIHLNPVRFYKLHSFVPNDFFDEDALMVPVVEDDASAEPFEIDAKQLAAASKQKEQVEPVKISKSSKPSGEIIEVDLHAASLIDNINGLSSHDILQYQLDKFKETMNTYIRFKGQKIVFIHGKGDGVLRAAILKELKHSFKQCTFQDASFQEYGFGATQVTIR